MTERANGSVVAGIERAACAKRYGLVIMPLHLALTTGMCYPCLVRVCSRRGPRASMIRGAQRIRLSLGYSVNTTMGWMLHQAISERIATICG